MRCFDRHTNVRYPQHEEYTYEYVDGPHPRVGSRGYCTRCGEVVDQAAYRRWCEKAGVDPQTREPLAAAR